MSEATERAALARTFRDGLVALGEMTETGIAQVGEVFDESDSSWFEITTTIAVFKLTISEVPSVSDTPKP